MARIKLRLDLETVAEVFAQPGLRVCPFRAAFLDSFMTQMPSELPLSSPRIRYSLGLQAPGVLLASSLPLHKSCPQATSPRCFLQKVTTCYPGAVAWLPCLPPPLPSPVQVGSQGSS